MKLDPETVARRGLAALVTQRTSLYASPTFPVREVRAAVVRCDDVLADPVTGEALTVVGVGWSHGGVIVLYVRDDKTQQPSASRRLHYVPREYVLRAVTDPAQPRAVHPGHERTNHE